LADLANSFAIVRHILPFPFGREALIAFGVYRWAAVAGFVLSVGFFLMQVGFLYRVSSCCPNAVPDDEFSQTR
jgi:hypothetical protein